MCLLVIAKLLTLLLPLHVAAVEQKFQDYDGAVAVKQLQWFSDSGSDRTQDK